MNRFFIALLASASVAAVSCSDDDEPKVPSNAITVNMMAVNSETTIG